MGGRQTGSFKDGGALRLQVGNALQQVSEIHVRMDSG
jgi:hypothetical protein